MHKKIISFLYHEVTDDAKTSGFQRPGALPYKHKVTHFLNDLELITTKFEKAISITALEQTQNTNQLLLTFDDGGASAVDVANTLSNHGLIGHFFITTSLIGKPNFLTTDEVISIHNMGHIIGSHSHSHPNIFRDLSYQDQLNEWSESKAILENIIDQPVICASVPGGDMDKWTIIAAAEAGIKYLFTSEPNYTPQQKFGVFLLGRVCPKNTTTSHQITKWCDGRGFATLKLIRVVKAALRTTLKPLYKIYVMRGENKT